MIDHAIETVQLQPYIDRPVTALPGGQMQHVALARSIVYAPRMLWLDEPLSNRAGGCVRGGIHRVDKPDRSAGEERGGIRSGLWKRVAEAGSRRR